MPPPRRRIIDYQVRKHAEIAAFLWGMRGHTAMAPYCTLSTLTEIDGRIDAHLVHVRPDPRSALEACGAPDAWQAGQAFVAAWTAFAANEAEAVGKVFEAVENAPDLGRHVAGSLGWLPNAEAEPHIHAMLESASPAILRVGIAAAVARAEHPGEALRNALEDEDPWLRSRALRAVGELGHADFRPHVEASLSDENDECRFAAAWSAALLGHRRAIPVLGALAVQGGSRAEQACAVALRALDLGSAHAAHREIVREFGTSRLTVIAAGMIGDPRFAAWLLEQMENPPLARAAAEAFSRITGADLAYDDLDGAEPPDEVSAGSEPAPDSPPGADADDGYLWPDVERVAAWWTARHHDFYAGHRYLLGQAITPDWLKEILRHGRQPHRAAAALEFALANPGRPLFDVRAPAPRQELLLRRDGLPRASRRRIEAG